MIQSTKMYIKPKNLKYVCPQCLSQYKLKIYYDRHVSACELLHQSNKERKDNNEKHSEIPDVSTMYEMILSLAQKNKELEAKVHELSQLAIVKKKRIHVNEWLNENYSGIICLNAYIKQISISQEDYERVCKQDYTEGISMILKNLFPIENEANLPIKAFQQKENAFFIKKDKQWTIMQNSDLDGIIRHIEKQLMGKFVEWQEKNKHRMMNERYSQEYTDILQKILGNNSASVKSNLRKILYKHLKMNLKNIIQFEFIV